MSHLDEGTLHALLDGELETHEVAEIQAHLGSCSSCGLRLREVKEFYAEADRLIGSVDLQAPATATPRPTPVPAAPAPSRTEAAPRRDTPRPQPPAGPAKWEPWNEPPPMLLVPDNESASERRMHRMRRFGWAAILLVIVGAGFVEARKFMPMSAEDLPPPSNAKAVLSPEETPNRDMVSSTATAPAKTDTVRGEDRLARTAPRNLATSSATQRAKDAKPAAPPNSTAASTSDRAETRTDSAELDEGATDTAADTMPTKNEADSASGADMAGVRARASEALAELDRERRRQQAAAATAALDARRKAPSRTSAAAGSVQPAAAPAPPPAPPTLEQRARVYLRIGLDEASRQLGGPAHVIEGLSPLFMGLVQGGSVTGADATRPVVRVVYQDSQGRLILLDQQRLREGQPVPTASPLSWTIGGTVMWLNGEAASEILRTYRPRVR